MTDTSHKRYPVPPGVHWGDPRFTPAQDAILRQLRAYNAPFGSTATMLAEDLHMSRQAAQQTLHRLLAKGLVNKEVRSYNVVLWSLRGTT